MESTIQRVAAFVADVAQTSRRGGACTVVDSTRCVLYDCGQWTSEMHDAVVRRFQGCSVTVAPLDSSVCGFVVIFDIQEHRSCMATVFIVLLAICSLSIMTAYSYRCAQIPLEVWPNFTQNESLFN